jgi:hypothetical protein
MGFNLPPGCNVSDLPGNTSEDMEWEILNDWLVDSMLTPIEIKQAIFKGNRKGYLKAQKELKERILKRLR